MAISASMATFRMVRPEGTKSYLAICRFIPTVTGSKTSARKMLHFLLRKMGLIQVKSWRNAVGGMWAEMGDLQFNFLVSQGLRPHHKFLDIGCGCLRGGIHFISYLNEQHYFGIDQSEHLLTVGRDIELVSAGLANKQITLLQNADFEFHKLGRDFDFALAQSVFTHLPMAKISMCLQQLKYVLAPEGVFFATFFQVAEGHPPSESLVHFPGEIETFADHEPYHHSLEQIEQMAADHGFEITYLGDWNHPRSQKMLMFRHKHLAA